MRFVSENGPGSVWIEVDNEKVAEWQKGEYKAGNAVEKTCYITAEAKAQYKIKYNFRSNYMKRPTVVDLYIDGQYIDSNTSGCDQVQSQVQGEFEGYEESTERGRTTLRTFSFDKVAITNDDALRDKSSEDFNSLCSIKVVIGWKIPPSNVDHRDEDTEQDWDALCEKEHHQDTKIACLGLATMPGDAITRDSTYVCHCNHKRFPGSTEYSFLFKYRRANWLIANGIIEGDESDDSSDGVYIDEERTARAAAMRRKKVEKQKRKRREALSGRGRDSEDRSDCALSLLSRAPSNRRVTEEREKRMQKKALPIHSDEEEEDEMASSSSSSSLPSLTSVRRKKR